MKRIAKYIGLTLAAAALAVSCDRNEEAVFNDKDAFVAFNDASLSVDENGDVIRIPVILASVSGIETTVAFDIAEPEQSGASEGKNYRLLTESKTLTFNADNRTQYIEIEPLYDDRYTGDLTIDINLKSNEDVGVGSEGTCTLTIADIDHPLTKFFGDYTMTGTKYGTKSPVSWTMRIVKDEDDDTKVWFFNLFGNDGWAITRTMYYGVVNADKTAITLPFGQVTQYKHSNGNPITLLGFDNKSGYSSGSLEIKVIEEDGKLTLDFGTEWGLWFNIEDVGYIAVYLKGPGISAVKN